MNYKITGIWRINHELVIANTIEEAIELYKTWFGSIEKNCEAEIKEVKRIGDNQIPERFGALIKDGEKCEQEWSEEDERLRDSCIRHIEDELESINNDKYGHSEIISDLKESCRERIDWLEKLKDRYTWKPSEEQMQVLWKYAEQNNSDGYVLHSLYCDLQKLKG